MELSVRTYLTAGVALTAASAIALTPVVATPGDHHLAVPYASVSEVQLEAAIKPADVAALAANLDAAMASVTATVTSMVDGSGHTLTGALTSAAAPNDNLWDGLIRAAGANPTLGSVLIALKAASAGGLSQLAQSVEATDNTIALSSGQLAGILTSTATGSLGSATQAVASVNNPISAESYLGLLNTSFGIAGMALRGGINAAATLATGGVHLTSTLVTVVSDQIINAVSLVNGLLDAGKSLTDVALIDGALTAVQGIVSAPVTAVLAGVAGITGAAANAATLALGRVAGGASGVVSTWLGNGSTAGALQNALVAIGTAPLSPASYTNAVSVLLGAGVTTVQTVVGTASSFASLPFRVGADLTGTAAEVINSFTGGLATAASGLMRAAGLPSFVAGPPYAVATAVAGAVNVAAFATAAALYTISTAIDIGQAIGGILNAGPLALSATAADPAALPDSVLRSSLVNTLTVPGDVLDANEDGGTSVPAASTTEDTATAADDPTTAAEAMSDKPTTDESPPETSPSDSVAAEVVEPAAPPTDGLSEEVATPAETAADDLGTDDAMRAPGERTDADTSDNATSAPATDTANPGTGRLKSTGSTGRHVASSEQIGPTTGAKAAGDGGESYGRHASGTTASESSASSGGRHRSDAQPAGRRSVQH
ncbi:hypothetical protein H5P33_04915 [Mycolicibacterium arabiense]|uniref:hypothetical protein n=1 Tax=Mycolicibacterium arabiense TaxID=1286181 RepID=UPI0013D81C19|nr:hypothetical protein [Mycolicibacterium arabiense]MCV7372052.1 hypothetical protein [Mycolicibacterium arabiense]